MGFDDDVGNAADAVAPLSFKLEIFVSREKIRKKIVDDGVDEAIENDRKLHGDVGYALGHRRREEVPVGDFKAVEEVAVLCSRCFYVATWYRDLRPHALGELLCTAQGSEDGRAEQNRTAAVKTCLGKGGDVVRPIADDVKDGAEEGEESKDCGVAFRVAKKGETHK